MQNQEKVQVLESKVKHLFVSEEEEQAQIQKEQLKQLIEYSTLY